MTPRTRLLGLMACLSCTAVFSTGFRLGPAGSALLFESPVRGLLSRAAEDNPNAVALRVRAGRVESAEITVDGTPMLSSTDGTLELADRGRRITGTLEALPAGPHQIVARASVRLAFFRFELEATTWIERVALDRPDDCEILNDVECILPFPSSRYLEPAPTETGYRVKFPQGVLPSLPLPLDSASFGEQDGFSPAVQIMVHFPGGVDPARSGASRLLEETRTHDSSSLDPDSPTLLFDVTAGMQPVLHWIERDARAANGPSPDREAIFMRPASMLTPGHRYVVAMRNLVHPDGNPVEAEPVFAALRDGRPSDLPAVEARRGDAERLFRRLRKRGVDRRDLVLAFDFVVQSERDLTGELLAMRDRSFEWLASQEPGTGIRVFPFAPAGEPPDDDDDLSFERDCSQPDVRTWRELRGTFEVPLFLSADPLLEPDGGSRLVDDDGDGLPDAQGVMEAQFAINIPCAALDPAQPQILPILTGHGLFGNGRQIVGVPQFMDDIEASNGGANFARISGSTSWLGLSSNEFGFNDLINNFIIQAVLLDANNFGTLPDRLRQGVVNTLVLARMMKQGHFNANEAFRVPGPGGEPGQGAGVFPGPDAPLDYFGISLGGIMGTLVGATSPDVDRMALDVPAANFSILIQRSTAIGLIDIVLGLLNNDPLQRSLFFVLAEELWDSAEPAGYLHRVTRNPFPGSGDAKDLLYTVAEHDGIVANTASAIAIRTLGLPNLHDEAAGAGSSVFGQPAIPDLASVSTDDPDFVGAVTYYDAGMYGDPLLADRLDFVPPLENQTAASSCDPHGRTFTIGAEVRQIVTYLNGGEIENFCDGLCEGRASGGGFEPFELPGGAAEPCDPRPTP